MLIMDKNFSKIKIMNIKIYYYLPWVAIMIYFISQIPKTYNLFTITPFVFCILYSTDFYRHYVTDDPTRR